MMNKINDEVHLNSFTDNELEKNNIQNNSNINTIKTDKSTEEELQSKHELKDNINLSSNNINLVNNIQIKITVELGSTKIKIKDLLSISTGKIITLDTLAGESLKILANGLLIAYGEIVVVDNKYGIRITHVLNSITSNSCFNKI